MRVSFSPAPVEPPTTKKEIWAWYSYAFASEAYVVVALTSFIPITLEALASEEGHLYGTNEPCITRPNTTDTSFLPATFEPQMVERPRCMVSFGHLEVDTASFVMYLTSLAVLLQALTVVSISSTADHGSYRKKQLVVFSTIGAVATMLIGTVPYVWMAGALSVVANVSFGAGIVCFNAYLPLLVRNMDRLRQRREQLEHLAKEIEADNAEAGAVHMAHTAADGAEVSDIQGLNTIDADGVVRAALVDTLERSDETEVVQPRSSENIATKNGLLREMSERLNEEKGHVMGQISAKGFASGYFGGILLLLVCLYISYRDKSSTRSLKVGIFLSGLWWFIFAALAGVWLKPRPGRELRLEDHGQKHTSLWVAFQYVLYSWRRVGATIRQARKLPSAFAFIVAWFFLSDGYTSIANVALLFAKTSLQLPQTMLILLSLEVPICALVGTLAFPKIQQGLGYDQKQMVLLLLVMLVMVPVYGTLGLILPFWPHLSTARELFMVAAYFGFLIGAVQRYGEFDPHYPCARLDIMPDPLHVITPDPLHVITPDPLHVITPDSFCRSMFADLIPRGRESEFFGLYAITDKGSSWLGPLAVAAITDATHEIRHAFVFLLVLLSLPIPIIYFGVNINQGRIDAEKASVELQQSQTAGEHDGQDHDEESERLLSSA
ncbi:Autophagy protein 22 [Mortierella claussenii]|nr:Autophagy protein 22 [Mortierella claussenii]